MAPGERKRWPWVTRPLRTSPYVTGTGFPSRSATIQRTGRAKVTSSPRVRMAFLKRSPATSRSRIAGTTCAAWRPFSTFVTASRSPLGVSTRSSAATSTPWLRAKPAAAGVGFPAASKACATGGPSAWLMASPCRGATSRAQTASRRGVPTARTSPWARRASSSAFDRSWASCCSAAGANPAGISSAPISKRRSAMPASYFPASAASRAARAASTAALRSRAGSMGKPSASREAR